MGTRRRWAPVVAAVADEQPLAVAHDLGVAGEVEVGRVVLQPVRDGLGQPPGRVDLPGQHVGDSAPGGLTAQPGLDQCLACGVTSPRSTVEPLTSTTTTFGLTAATACSTAS